MKAEALDYLAETLEKLKPEEWEARMPKIQAVILNAASWVRGLEQVSAARAEVIQRAREWAESDNGFRRHPPNFDWNRQNKATAGLHAAVKALEDAEAAQPGTVPEEEKP